MQPADEGAMPAAVATPMVQATAFATAVAQPMATAVAQPMATAVAMPTIPGLGDPGLVQLIYGHSSTFTGTMQLGAAKLDIESSQTAGSLTNTTNVVVTMCGCCPIATLVATTQFAADCSSFVTSEPDGSSTGTLVSFEPATKRATYSSIGLNKGRPRNSTVVYDGLANTVTHTGRGGDGRTYTLVLTKQ